MEIPVEMADLVRSSRDGDQFHYLWAARRCLALLSPTTDLVGISIEGASPKETPIKSAALAGDTVIDIAEYYGDTDLSRAQRVRYMQLKHSTRRTAQAWTAGGLETTLRGFAAKHEQLLQRFSADYLSTHIEFWFVTNRPVNSKVIQAVDDAACGTAPRHPSELQKLEQFTGLTCAELSSFCRLLHFEDRQDDYWNQRNILFQEVSGYLPGPNSDAPVQLKELVTRKASSEAGQNPLIEKMNVLRALGTDESSLYPAPCRIAAVDNAIPREQEADLVRDILDAEGRPVVVHALSGVGKSVFATRIQQGLPKGSVSILYDCFGNGEYRSANGSRHRHQDALVQMANELAARALCYPLIAIAHAEAIAYVRAFISRVRQAVNVMRGTEPAGVLCIVIDAADNAEQAARERGESRSFARDLLRESFPDGVRLVVLCRSHRQNLLDPPPCALRLELTAFTNTQTAAHLRQSFPDASRHDVEEFHYLSSQNPRVQALALSQAAERNRSLPETLRRLGPYPTTVDDAIESLLNDALTSLRDSADEVEVKQIDRVCTGLALLRPMVPISVLAEMSRVSEEAIRSFVLDIGRPLLLSDNAVQFRDEPVETWFRERFRPQPDEMSAFIRDLVPLAAKSGYVAATLPQLMLEAGQFSELVSLALGSSALPETSEMDKRAVELARAHFALKAALRSGSYLDAAKLALKAGEGTAGDGRRNKLIQSNTDLAALFFDSELIQEIVLRRVFGSRWRGSHHVYEAGLLSGCPTFVGDARSRLRMAHEWLSNWSRLSKDERQEEPVTDVDLSELVIAELNVHGSRAAARAIDRWRPRSVSFRVGRIVVRRLIDHDRVADANGLAEAAGEDFRLVLAVTLELREIQQTPPVKVVDQAFRRVQRLSAKARKADGDETMDAITALVEATLKLKLCSRDEAAKLLTRYLPATPPRGVASRFSGPRSALLRAYSLRAALKGETLELTDLAHPELRTELEKQSSHDSTQEVQEFKRDVGALLPWYRLWAVVSCGDMAKEALQKQLAMTRDASMPSTEYHYPNGRHVAGAVALVWFEVLNLMDTTDAESVETFAAWIKSLNRPLFTPELHALARLGVRREETRPFALGLAAQGFHLIKNERTDAESKSDGYIDAARAVLFASTTEAKAYFDEAVAVASKVGDENVPRWEAILNLADRAARPDRTAPAIAYRFARCAELTYDYAVRDEHFDWFSTVRALAALCPSSSVAILSRWRDRNFGWTGEVLPTLTNTLIERDCVDPQDVIPLIGFEGRWEYAELLDAALQKCTNQTQKEAVKELLFRYVKRSTLGASTWRQLREVAARHALPAAEVDAYVACAEREESTTSRNTVVPASNGPAARDLAKQKWDEIFAENDLTTADGIAASYAAFRRTPPPLEHEEFFAEAIRRIPPGAESAFLTAARDVPVFSLHCFSDLLAQIPDGWRKRLAVQQGLASTIKTICRRYCMEITKHRHWIFPPFNDAFKQTGVSEADIINAVLDGIGESTVFADSNRLFSVVGLLASKLSGDEALEVLDFGLGFFDSVLEDGDGDGRWSDDLVPTGTVKESLAGYIYAGLAAPSAEVRWQAAHAVLGLCALGRTDMIRHLVTLRDTGTGGPFVDARLPFYRLHAFQWLMIACARAAIEYPTALAPVGERFADWALSDQPHVMIRQFAARTALALLQHGLLPPDVRLEKRLRGVNVTSLPVVESRSFERISHETMDADKSNDNDRLYFYMDIGPYWYKPLGEVFALPQSRIETQALEVIHNELHRPTDGRTWREDERKRRGLYGRDRYGSDRTYASHGSYPVTDDYEFYLSYHAMMIVAGKLLATTSTHRDAELREQDEFAEWMSRHDLTRNEGRWLADRRDPAPLKRPGWLDRKEGDPAYGLVTPMDFDEALWEEDTLNVWGRWSIADQTTVQSVCVQSALVSRDRSAALLRALSTVDNVYDYVIPSAGLDQRIDRAGFVLEGWVQVDGGDGGLDDKDRWSGGVGYPPPAPAAQIVELMALGTDADKRVWRGPEDRQVLSSQMWGHSEARDEDQNPERGERLRASVGFVKELLNRCGRDLIVAMEIQRRRRRPRYDWRGDNDEGTAAETKFYLIRANGHVTAL